MGAEGLRHIDQVWNMEIQRSVWIKGIKEICGVLRTGPIPFLGPVEIVAPDGKKKWVLAIREERRDI